MSDTRVNGTNGTNGTGAIPLADVPIPLATTGTDFKAVAIGAGANLESLPTYFNDPLLATGNLPGLAISSFNNRALRQGTFVASSLCLWMSGQLQQYIPDDGNQINWQSEWQNALAHFVSALIPSGPDLGAYLPLAGGTMVGNIQFQAGISTVLANNTWYYALDTGGTARGLIIKNVNNDITINDGTAAHVVIAGQPTTNNNQAWSGKDTGGTIRVVAGLLSDNAIHIGSSATGEVYFDNTGSIHSAGNFILNNNRFIYGNDTGGTARSLLGLNNGNQFLVGIGVTGETDIYGPSQIYLRHNATAAGIFQVNGYCYLQGGSRSYIPGGNDPHQIYADHGFYARIHYIVGGTRDWTCGCLYSGNFAIADESAAAIRWQIDTAGNIIVYASETINGNLYVSGGQQISNGLTVYNSINIASGNLSVSNTGYVYNQLQVWNHLYIQSGDLHVQGGSVYAAGTVQGAYLYSTGNLYAAGSIQSGFLYSTGNGQFDGALHANSDLTAGGNFYIGGGQSTMQHVSCNNGLCIGNSAINFDYTFAFPIGNHSQWVSGLGLYAQFFSAYSDQEAKQNIGEVDRDALAAIRPIKFFQYDIPRTTLHGPITDERSHVTTGLLAQQVRESFPDAVIETEQPVTFHEDHDPLTGEVGCGWDTKPALALDLMTMLAYSMRAIQQLAERVESLEKGSA
jgi:endosialidase-like protein